MGINAPSNDVETMAMALRVIVDEGATAVVSVDECALFVDDLSGGEE